MEHVQGAVSEFGSRMTLRAVLLLEHFATGKRRGGKCTVLVAIGTVAKRRQRTDIRSEGVEVRAQAGFWIPQRLRTRSGVKVRITHQSSAEGKVAYLAFEVLHLIEIAGPMQWAVSNATAATQRDCIPQAFAELR